MFKKFFKKKQLIAVLRQRHDDTLHELFHCRNENLDLRRENQELKLSTSYLLVSCLNNEVEGLRKKNIELMAKIVELNKKLERSNV